MRLSQGHLNVLDTCPRKFQYTYLDQLGGLTTPEQQTRLAWGSRFHLLVQQRELGLPIEPLIQADEELQACFTAFVEGATEVFQGPWLARHSEHPRSLEFQGHGLTVVYDLLLLSETQADILDWKTYARPQTPRWLAQNWQTRLYPYLLAETSHYLPEQISMTYWFVQPFVRHQEEQAISPTKLKFSYSDTLHQEIHQRLTELAEQVTEWLQAYQAGNFFPQIPETAGHCQTCPFVIRCDRHSDEERSPSIERWLSNMAEIEEVPL
ncbi:MAG: PD-(D/E)XK nuclease family protein [Leptolyngbyaceae bacterium]|nr:PD-(D/E)XK nuclease family protein [Leptolyngbyaceae bacterium]